MEGIEILNNENTISDFNLFFYPNLSNSQEKTITSDNCPIFNPILNRKNNLPNFNPILDYTSDKSNFHSQSDFCSDVSEELFDDIGSILTFNSNYDYEVSETFSDSDTESLHSLTTADFVKK